MSLLQFLNVSVLFYSDLDENLQKAFLKYLEIRGITPNTTNFLQEYMFNKDNKEYLGWLKKLKSFIAKWIWKRNALYNYWDYEIWNVDDALDFSLNACSVLYYDLRVTW